MNESVVVILLANSNHLSNVKALQRIYSQDYENINVIVCNDHTYGFENERLLYNFEHDKPENIQQVYFRENRYAVGEYESQAQFWDLVDAEYIVTIHSGEYLTSPTILSQCIAEMNNDPSISALVANAEKWSVDFKKKLDVDMVVKDEEQHFILNEVDPALVTTENIRDCMVIYRLDALKKVNLQLSRKATQISQYIVADMLNHGERIALYGESLCRYSQGSIRDVGRPVPSGFGEDSVGSGEPVAQAHASSHHNGETLFRSTIQAPAGKAGKNIHLKLHKLSTLKRIGAGAVLTLMLIIAAGLFLHLDYNYAPILGFALLIGAAAAAVFTVFMLCCNLYYKKNPQRLVKVK